MNWIKGFLEDYLSKTNKEGTIFNNIEKTTITIFQRWEGFLIELRANFGVIDEKKEVERALEGLKQKGSAIVYIRDFQRYSTQTGQGGEALMYQYRKGLKDLIKDKLLRTGQDISILPMLIVVVCEIDNAQYERSIEYKGKYNPNYKRIREGKYRNFCNNTYNYSDLIELDAMHQKELLSQEQQKHMINQTYFNCRKPRHITRNCRSGGSKPYY